MRFNLTVDLAEAAPAVAVSVVFVADLIERVTLIVTDAPGARLASVQRLLILPGLQPLTIFRFLTDLEDFTLTATSGAAVPPEFLITKLRVADEAVLAFDLTAVIVTLAGAAGGAADTHAVWRVASDGQRS